MSPDERKASKVFRRTFWRIAVPGVLVLVAVGKLWPTSSSVSSNVDNMAPLTTRTLAPRQTTTTSFGPAVQIGRAHV